MYLHLGQAVVVPEKDILGIFDLDNSSWAYKTREFLDRAEDEGRVVMVGADLPRSMVLCGDGMVYLSQLSPTTLKSRVENGWME